MNQIDTDNYLDLEYPDDPQLSAMHAMLAVFGVLIALIVGMVIIWLVKGR